MHEGCGLEVKRLDVEIAKRMTESARSERSLKVPTTAEKGE
jgi:hypothetical protein